jgi:hypothetical protein
MSLAAAATHTHITQAVRDFLMQCFQKDPNLRVSAKKLLRHPWILSGRRSDQPVAKPTQYDEAVKSVQQWNEALKSSPQNTSSRRSSSRPLSLSPVPHRADVGSQLRTPAINKGGLALANRANDTKPYQSPESDARDNWDDDFATSIGKNTLQLPHLKPHDNFAGMLSSDKLKQYATFDMNAEEGEEDNWDDNFEGDLTVRRSMERISDDPMETVRPFFPPRAKTFDTKQTVPAGRTQPPSMQRQLQRPLEQADRDEPSRTQILRPLHKMSKSESIPATAPVRPSLMYREKSTEDYSDLLGPDNDSIFRQKLAALTVRNGDSFASKLFHPSDLKSLPQPISRVTSMRRASPQIHDAAAMRRTRSEMEIQKYQEDPDDDFSDINFGNEDGPQMQQSESESGSEIGTLMLNSKLSTNSWLGDEEDEDDPFAQLEEGFDEMDLETNIARDKFARLVTLVEGLVGSLKVSQSEDYLEDIVDQLFQVLWESPEVKTVVISSHGMLPMLEILESCNRPTTILRLLQVVNLIIMDNVEIQENLCFVGGIPIITRFAQKRYSSDIRLEAAAFVRQMYQTSTLTLQMFVSCGGLNVLVEFLEEDYEAERDLVLIGVNGVWSVFELQGPTPKNDFCRIFSRSAVLYPLSLVLNRVLEEEGELAELVEGRIVNIFVLFSQAENHVKEAVADRMVLKRVLKDLKRMSPQHQITMLKFIKNLSMLATTLDALQNSNAIEVLTDLLNASMKVPHFREISNQVLNIMYNLCRLSKTRQEDAALNGVIPLLQRIVKTERPLKEFALPIMCDMAHSGKVGRKILWQNKGLQFYVSLLADQYWQVTALDAIFVWLQEETAKVEEHLLRDDSFSKAIINCFNHSKADSFENFLEPLQKLLRLSPPLASSLIHPDLFLRTAQKLRTKKALVRLNLLRIIRSICDSSDEDGALIHTYGLHPIIAETAKYDPAILVREMASDLIKSSELHVSRAVHNARVGEANTRRPLRRSSSSTMVPTGSSLPPTPTTDRMPLARIGSYFDASGDLQRPFSRGATTGIASPYRPISRDGGSGGSSSGWTATATTAATATTSNSGFLSSPGGNGNGSGGMTLSMPGDRGNKNNNGGAGAGGGNNATAINNLVSKSRLPRTSHHSRGNGSSSSNGGHHHHHHHHHGNTNTSSGARLSLVTAEGRTSRPGSKSGFHVDNHHVGGSSSNHRSENVTPKTAGHGHVRTPSRLSGQQQQQQQTHHQNSIPAVPAVPAAVGVGSASASSSSSSGNLRPALRGRRMTSTSSSSSMTIAGASAAGSGSGVIGSQQGETNN